MTVGHWWPWSCPRYWHTRTGTTPLTHDLWQHICLCFHPWPSPSSASSLSLSLSISGHCRSSIDFPLQAEYRHWSHTSWLPLWVRGWYHAHTHMQTHADTHTLMETQESCCYVLQTPLNTVMRHVTGQGDSMLCVCVWSYKVISLNLPTSGRIQ